MIISAIEQIPSLSFLVPWLTGFVAVAAALATQLPPPKIPAAGWYPAFYGIVNWVALNVGQAKNATAPKEPAP